MAKAIPKTPPRQLWLFVSSPSDVAEDRSAVATIVARINAALGERHGFQLRLWRWERDAVRRLGAPPQAVVDRQLPDYDIYLGIMSARFGTPGEGYGSGTEKEFRDALKRHDDEGRPELLFYFDGSPPTPKKSEAAREFMRVVEFREELENLGLVGEYHGLDGGDDSFGHRVQQDLTKTVLELLEPREARAAAAEQDPARYLRWLLSRCSHLDIRGLKVGTGEVHRLPIEQLYVALRTQSPRGGPRRPTDRPGKSASGETDPAVPRHVDLREMLANRRLVIVGDPGAGKTTFLRRVASSCCRQHLAADGSPDDWLKTPAGETWMISAAPLTGSPSALCR